MPSITRCSTVRKHAPGLWLKRRPHSAFCCRVDRGRQSNRWTRSGQQSLVDRRGKFGVQCAGRPSAFWISPTGGCRDCRWLLEWRLLMRWRRDWPISRPACTGPTTFMWGRGKLAGILVEVLPSGLHIIGVGLNSNNSAADAPPPLRETVATLRDLTGERTIIPNCSWQLRKTSTRL